MPAHLKACTAVQVTILAVLAVRAAQKALGVVVAMTCLAMAARWQIGPFADTHSSSQIGGGGGAEPEWAWQNWGDGSLCSGDSGPFVAPPSVAGGSMSQEIAVRPNACMHSKLHVRTWGPDATSYTALDPGFVPCDTYLAWHRQHWAQRVVTAAGVGRHCGSSATQTLPPCTHARSHVPARQCVALGACAGVTGASRGAAAWGCAVAPLHHGAHSNFLQATCSSYLSMPLCSCRTVCHLPIVVAGCSGSLRGHAPRTQSNPICRRIRILLLTSLMKCR